MKPYLKQDDDNATIVAKRKYIGSVGSGMWTKRVEVVAICQEERGKFYVEVPSLNFSGIGVGDTPDSAFADWERAYYYGGNWHTIKELPITEVRNRIRKILLNEE